MLFLARRHPEPFRSGRLRDATISTSILEVLLEFDGRVIAPFP